MGPSHSPQALAAQAVVLYDAECGFCRWMLARLLAWDRRAALRPVPIESPEGNRLLAGLDRERRLDSWHLVRDGRRYSAGEACPPLLELLPAGRPLAWLSARLPRLTEASYALVAASRSRLGSLIPAGAVNRADTRIRKRRTAE